MPQSAFKNSHINIIESITFQIASFPHRNQDNKSPPDEQLF